MVIGILNFGEGLLPLTFLVMVTVASLGAIQIAAAHARLVGLLLLPISYSRWLGIALVLGSYVWFFSAQPDLFIPGLAGGELFSLFLTGFGLSVLLALGFGIISNRLLVRRMVRAENCEAVDLGGGQRGVLWLPATSRPSLVLALREVDTDSLDILSGKLVAAGAAVLMCDERAATGALAWAEREAARFGPRGIIMGVGRAADRALALAAVSRFQGVLALAPFGDSFHARPGLRWLREADYLTGIRATWHKPPIEPARSAEHARIIYGDEDLLIRPSDARKIFPNAIMVAGARHLNLAGMPAVFRLAADLLDLHVQPAAEAQAAVGQVSSVRREASE